MRNEVVIRSPFSATPDSVAKAAWDRNIHTQVERAAAAVWNKNRKGVLHLAAIQETREVEVTEAVSAVVAHPLRNGQPVNEIYIGRFPSSTGKGDVINLTALWGGAVRLAGGDPDIRMVRLEKNPNLYTKGNETVLTVHRAVGKNGEVKISQVIYSSDSVPIQADRDARKLAPTILDNIVKELK